MIKNMVYKKGCLEFFRHLIIFPNTDLDDAAVVAPHNGPKITPEIIIRGRVRLSLKALLNEKTLKLTELYIRPSKLYLIP